jgi:putative tricarboxylic transport membrane protein
VKSWQRIAAVVFLLVSAVVIQQSVWVLRLSEDGQPGSGLMPFLLGVLLAILSLALLVASRGQDEKKVPFWERRAWLLPLAAIVITTVFIEVFDDIGAITSVVVLVTGWLKFVSRKRLQVAVLTGLLTGAAVYLLFDKFLKTPFPRGLLF